MKFGTRQGMIQIQNGVDEPSIYMSAVYVRPAASAISVCPNAVIRVCAGDCLGTLSALTNVYALSADLARRGAGERMSSQEAEDRRRYVE